MYLDFYGLSEKPFNTTPDPRFLFLTPSHREALAQLTYGVREGTGLVVLTGEVGTGKTTLLQALMQRLDPQVAVATIVSPMLEFDGLLELILEDFGIDKREETTAQRLVALRRFLVERAAAGHRTVVIIDEAQHLQPATLEQIRLLSNYESPSRKLLQIILAGQPELGAKLDLPQLRQVKQRIGLRCTISPLTAPGDARVHRHSAPDCQGSESGPVHRACCGSGVQVRARDSQADEHRVRAQPLDRVCGPGPSHRSPSRGGSHSGDRDAGQR